MTKQMALELVDLTEKTLLIACAIVAKSLKNNSAVSPGLKAELLKKHADACDEITSGSKLRAAIVEMETVTVCDKCFQASCWQGIFLCDESRDAGVIEMLKSELAKLGYESPHYWEPPESRLR